MSSLIVQAVTVDRVDPIEGYDRIECATVRGWTCVVGKGQYQPGSLAVYIPPEDSVLTPKFCEWFWRGGKVKAPSNGRLRTNKIAKVVSQGILLNPKDPEALELWPKLAGVKLGDDVADILEITKWEPPASSMPKHMQGKSVRRHPQLLKYTDIENIKHFPDLFEPGEVVHISEKLHGTSVHYGLLEKHKLTFFEKIKKFLGFKIGPEFCVSSRNIQLSFMKPGNKFPKEYNIGEDKNNNVYVRIAKELDIKSKLAVGETLYGEIVNVQKNYTYGCKPGEVKFYAYDLRRGSQMVDVLEFNTWCATKGIETCPQIYIGPFDQDVLDQETQGDSLVGGQKVREGVVVKAYKEAPAGSRRKILKSINPRYLLKGDTTEFS